MHNEIKTSNNTKSAFVALIGEANAGKSTFMNAMIGEKVSIVSPKAQTTRSQVKGIVEFDESQIVFIDTPGFCKPRSALESAIKSSSKNSYKHADIILLIVDATSNYQDGAFSFMERLKETELPVCVILNKIDAVFHKENLLNLASQFAEFDFIENIFMVSSLKNDGLEEVKEYLKSKATPSVWFYDENQTTDSDLKFRLSEITREKLFYNLEKELPYNIYVETEKIDEEEKKATIYQSIIVMKDSQKGIILGRGGSMITVIRESAQKEINHILGKRVKLNLFVKVKEKWTEKKAHLQNAGIIE